MWWTTDVGIQTWRERVFRLPGVHQQIVQFARENDTRGRLLRIPVRFQFALAAVQCWLQRRLFVLEFLPPHNPEDDLLYTADAAFMVDFPETASRQSARSRSF